MNKEPTFSSLMEPNVTARNKRGDIIFRLKRKEDERGKGLFYLFQIHWDRMDEEDRQRFELGWEFTKEMARAMGFPLFDIAEVNKAIVESIRDVAAGESPELRMVTITDHATGDLAQMGVQVTKKDLG